MTFFYQLCFLLIIFDVEVVPFMIVVEQMFLRGALSGVLLACQLWHLTSELPEVKLLYE